ncbi:MAG: hypothetical protein HYV02_01770 [Deltaproteobacteria bacterium]|nr:hypothetical protein [Deltaproteobacteria bacterium]
MTADRIFGLPHIPEQPFNRLAKSQAGTPAADAPQWHDADGDQQIEPEELTAHAERFTETVDGTLRFNARFAQFYRGMVEAYRQELVGEELTLTYREKMTTDMDAWLRGLPKEVGITEAEIAQYKTGIKALLRAGPWMSQGYGEQIGYSDTLCGESARTTADADLLSRYGHPWCLSNTSSFCVALPSLPKRTQAGVVDPRISCADVGNNMLSLGNPFSADVVDANGWQRAVPYAEHFAHIQQPVAQQLREAARAFAQIPREAALVTYLTAAAEALESRKPFPYETSDEAWRQHGRSASILYVRVGADEVGGDTIGDHCERKARYSMSIGIKNFAAAKTSDTYKPHVQAWEKYTAELIGDPALYVEGTAAMSMPLFWDIIYSVGDAVGGPAGTVIGQTLPNWCGSDGLQEPCGRLTMIFKNKEESAYKPEMMARYLFPLLNPAHHADFLQKIGPDATILHELGHNLGPQLGKPKPGSSAEFGSGLRTKETSWAGTIEEFKGQNYGIDLPGWLVLRARERVAAGEMAPEKLAETEQ